MPFLTGDDTATTVEISLTLPDDEHLIAAVLGQLTSLTYPSIWEQDGTATPGQRADEMREAIGNLDHAPGGDMLVLRDRMPDYMFTEAYAEGVDAGGFNNGAWRDRNINFIAMDRNAQANLDEPEWSVPTGNYWVEAYAIANRVGDHKLRFYRKADSFEYPLQNAILANAASGSGSSATIARVSMYTTFTTGVLQVLQHRCATSKATNGRGRASDWGGMVAAVVKLWKVGDPG